MCGIVGAVGGDEIDIGVVGHRGRDGIGTWSEHGVTIGHTLLSILDTTQPQPYVTHDYAVVFNGYLSNYRDYASNECMAIIILWRRYGIDAPRYMRGMFAMAVYDRMSREVYLVRDPLGIKPMYYNRSHFASEMTALEHNGVNWYGLKLAFRHKVCPQPMTIYEGIRSVERGTVYNFTVGRTHRYYELSPSDESDPDEFMPRLRASVERNMDTSYPLAVMLSGGVDSALIALMARADTYTLDGDEVTAAAHIAEMLGVHNYVIPNELCDIDEFVRMNGQPYYSMDVTGVMASAMSDDGVRVAINGMGADELCGGYQNRLPYRGGGVTCYFERVHEIFSERECVDMFGITDRHEWNFPKCRDWQQTIAWLDVQHYIGNWHVHNNDVMMMRYGIEGRFPYLDMVDYLFNLPREYRMGKRLLYDRSPFYHGRKRGFSPSSDQYDKLLRRCMQEVRWLRREVMPVGDVNERQLMMLAQTAIWLRGM